MNINTIRPTNETKVFLLSVTKFFEMLLKQPHTKAKKRLNLSSFNQEEPFLSNHLLLLVLTLIRCLA